MSVRHPRRPVFARLGVVAIVVALACATSLHAAPASAAASAHGGAVLLDLKAPNYTLQGIKWTDRTRIDIYYTWGGGSCVLGGQDLSGPASVMPADVALGQLRAAITDINASLRGALTLQLVGEATRADLCGRDESKPIVVGWGSFAAQSEDGLAITAYQSDPVVSPAPIHLSRIFIRNDRDLSCAGTTDPYRDLRHFMLHELLHGLGLGHSGTTGAIMEPVSTICHMNSALQPDDIAAVNALYPPPPGPSSNVPSVPGAAAGAFTAAPAFSSAGQALAVFSGGSVTQLEAAAKSVGATGVWAQQANGTYRLDVLGGPSFVNDAFRTAFAAGFATATAVTLTR